MKLRDIMSAPAIRVGAGEPVTVAARTLAQYDLGALPVCSADGKPVGLLTDRDIVTRCLAAGRDLAGPWSGRSCPGTPSRRRGTWIPAPLRP